MSTIQCASLDDFLNTIHGLVARGLVFHADSDRLRITLTGGH